MPTYTTTYLFPSPALGETADGPAAITALAARVEREMPILRASMEEFKDVGGQGIGPGSTLLVHEKDVAVAALGWAEAEVNYCIGLTSATVSDYSLIAGQLSIWLNDVQVRNVRFHNNARVRQITGTFTGVVALQGATNLNVKFRCAADGGSVAVTAFYDNFNVRQYGAPLAG